MINGQPQKNGLLIRDARPEELDEIGLLTREAYTEYMGSIPPQNWQAYVEDMMNVRGRMNVSELIVAEVDGRLAGAVTFFPDNSRYSEDTWPKGWAAVRLLAVRPAYRGRGIARALMEECIRRCRERKIPALGLHTTTFMSIARGLYERMGFARAPEYDFHPSPDVVVMAYHLRL